ncbi:MAG: hypothetical protein HZB29_10740 [Nitrospinae bacterium]|nr:hypothetical protein [Nitrospinota bacterium]
MGAESGAADEPAPISFPRKAIPAKDKKLAIALGFPPQMIRDAEAGADLRTTRYLMKHPSLCARLMGEYGRSATLEKDEDSGAWTLKAASGASYVFTVIHTSEEVTLLKFNFFIRSGMGIGLKISGTGALVIKTGPGEGKGATRVDYDVYFARGALPLDSPASAIQVHEGVILGDFGAILQAFSDLSGSVTDEAGLIAREMEREKDTFAPEEVKEFRKMFVRQGTNRK